MQRRAARRAKRATEILPQTLNRRPFPGFVSPFANPYKVSKGPQRGKACFLFAHPTGLILVGLSFDVVPQLFIEILILAVAHQQRTQTQRNCVQPVLESHLHTSVNRNTPEIAAEIRSQLAASFLRCRLPSRVSE